MKLLKVGTLLMLAVLVTGCSKKHPHTNPADVCRSPKTTNWRDVSEPVGSPAKLTDNVEITTGEVNGEDGVTITGKLWKRDGSGNLVSEQTFTDTGSVDGVTVIYAPNTVTVQLAVTRGYARLEVYVFYTCH